LVARENSRLFIIDEPEISLNVKWQRQLLDVLLACTSGTSLQFLVATHSIEMVASHRESVARLVNERGA
jgi:predicted ATP-dependent endonuclease of OLD family